MGDLTDEQRREALRKWRRRAVLAGVVLGLTCKSLPHEYQAPCRAIANLCSGGINLNFNTHADTNEGTEP